MQNCTCIHENKWEQNWKYDKTCISHERKWRTACGAVSVSKCFILSWYSFTSSSPDFSAKIASFSCQAFSQFLQFVLYNLLSILLFRFKILYRNPSNPIINTAITANGIIVRFRLNILYSSLYTKLNNIFSPVNSKIALLTFSFFIYTIHLNIFLKQCTNNIWDFFIFYINK